MGYGDGTTSKNANGTYTMRVMVDGKRYKRTARTKTEVRAKISQLRESIARGEQEAKAKRSTLTVADVVGDWLANDLAGREVAPSTVDRHHQSAKHVVRLLGDRQAIDLSVRDVEGAFTTLADEGQARASIAKIRATLSQSLQGAVRRGDLDRNVARDALLPASAAKTAPRRSLLPDEARMLLTHLHDVRNGLAFGLGLLLGLRPGEAWALFWEDVDLEAGTVNVTRGLSRSGGKVFVSDDLKTAASKRTLLMSDDLVRWFSSHRAAQVAEKLAAPKGKPWQMPELVFATPIGTLPPDPAPGNVVDPGNSRRHLAAICVEAGVPMIRPNELRHSCASLLSDEGVSNELIADLLGHTTTRMVDQTYRHRLRPIVDVAASAAWSQAK